MQKWLSTAENQIINNEVAKLLQKEVIRVLEPEEGQVTEKKDGSHRMILNFKALNDKVEYQKYQMETAQTAVQLVTENCYFASNDLQDAYFSVPIHADYQKYFKFHWRDILYCFQVAVMSLAPIPWVFTKLTKPMLAYLNDLGHVITSFIDDSLRVGEMVEEVCKNIKDTAKIFDSLGFVVHCEKSQFSPS